MESSPSSSSSSEDHSSRLFNIFFDTQMDLPKEPASSPSPSQSSPDYALITTAPTIAELRNRQADCSQADQSASQAIQQASQQASDSIQQIQGQASNSAAAATRSATAAIQQAQQSADQAVSAASRSVSAALQSASGLVASAQSSAASVSASALSVQSSAASVQSSAADAVSRALGSMTTAQASASTAQGQASKAVLEASAAVVAAGGKAAAAGSSFLAAAALATQSAQASVSAIGQAASSQIAESSQTAALSQTVAITATQIAIAIVGSIIASALITILIYFLITRHRNKGKDRKRRSQAQSQSPRSGDLSQDMNKNEKFDSHDETASTVNGSQASFTPANDRDTSSQASISFSLFPKDSSQRQSQPTIKSTAVAWNPSYPPRPPSLGGWLKSQDRTSPFPGAIALPNDKSSAPLGGQLKSPLQDLSFKPRGPGAPQFRQNVRSPTIPEFARAATTPPLSTTIPNLKFRNPTPNSLETQIRGEKAIAVSVTSQTAELVKPVLIRQDSSHSSKSTTRKPLLANADPLPSNSRPRESGSSSIWSDGVSTSPPSPMSPFLPRVPAQNVPVTATEQFSMQLPVPNAPVRNTAEWLSEQTKAARQQRPGSTQPPAAEALPRGRLGLPSRPGPGGARQAQKSIYGDGGLRGLINGGNMAVKGRAPSNLWTPGIGKAQ